MNNGVGVLVFVDLFSSVVYLCLYLFLAYIYFALFYLFFPFIRSLIFLILCYLLNNLFLNTDPSTTVVTHEPSSAKKPDNSPTLYSLLVFVFCVCHFQSQ